MIDVVLRYSTHELMLDKLGSLGVPVRRELKAEEQIARCSSPEIITHQGNVRTIRLHESEWAKVPEVTSPYFLIDWDSDTEGLEWPSYTHDATDADGNLYVTTVQAGRIG